MALLTFPKVVDIENPKLHLLHHVIWSVVFIAVTCKFIFARDYAATVDVSSDIHHEIWAQYPSYAEAEAHVQLMRNSSPYCLTAERYNFWWDPEGWDTYTNYTCLPMCPEGTHGWDCFSLSHSAVHLPSSVMLVTAMKDSLYTDVAGQPPEYIQRQWVWTAEIMGLGFSYSYNVRHRPFSESLGRMFSFIFPYDVDVGWDVGTSLLPDSGQKPLTTYILDSKRKVWRVVPPGRFIGLETTEIFELIGDKAILDHPNEYATDNQLQGAAMPGKPVTRLSGLHVEMELACYNGPNPNLDRGDLEGDDDWASVCTVQFLRPSIAWVYAERNFYRDGLLQRYYYGLEISVVHRGSFMFPDHNEMFLNLVAALVVLGYPSKIILFITLHCLGHMSKIYKRALVDDFDVACSVTGAAARLTAGTSAFDILEGQSASHGISFERFRKHVGTVLASRHELRKEEVDSVAKYCFRKLTQREGTAKKGLRGSFARLMGISGLTKEMDAHGTSMDVNASIMLDDFLIAYNEESPITLEDLAVLFDKDRKVSVPERLFTPKRLYKQIHQARRAPDLSDDDRLAIPVNETTRDSDDVDPATEELRHLQGRLQDSENRLAEAEQSLRDWQQRGADMASAMSAMEMRLRELERHVGQPQQTDCNVIVAPAKHSEDVSTARACGQGISEQVQRQVSLLEHQVSLMSANFPETPGSKGRSAQAVVTAAAVAATAEEAESKAESVTPVAARVTIRPHQEGSADPCGCTGPPSEDATSSLEPKTCGRHLRSRVERLEDYLTEIRDDIWKIWVFLESRINASEEIVILERGPARPRS